MNFVLFVVGKNTFNQIDRMRIGNDFEIESNFINDKIIKSSFVVWEKTYRSLSHCKEEYSDKIWSLNERSWRMENSV